MVKLKKVFSYYFFIIFLLFFFVAPSYALNSPDKISTSNNDSLAPTVITDSNGKVHLVWMDAPNSWSSSTISLLHSIWNGNTWSSPITIASSDFYWLPSLAAGSSGNVYLTYGNENTGQIFYSSYNGVSWSSATVISNDADGYAWDSEITIDSSGKPQVAYTVTPPTAINSQNSIYHTVWTGSTWTTPVNLSSAGAADSFPAIAADSSGKVHIVWKSQTDGTVTEGASKIVHKYWNGTTHSSLNTISGTIGDGQQPQPKITTDKNNNAHVVWEECTSTTGHCWDEPDSTTGASNLMYSKWNGTSWSSPFTVTTSSLQSREQIPSIGVIASSTNDVYTAWIDQSTSPLKVGFRKYNNSTSSWETAQTNSTSVTNADFPVLTIDKWDNVHIGWSELNSGTSKFELFYDVVPVAVKVIGSSGGNLSTSNGDTMTIPVNSLPSDTIISMQIAPLTFTAPEGYSALARQYIFEPSGTTFSPAITVVFQYSDAEFSGAAEKNLGIYVWDSQTSAWVFKTGTINKGANTVTVSIDHFSVFSIFAAPDITTWITPLVEDGENIFKTGRTIPIKFSFDVPAADPNQAIVQILSSSNNVVKEFTSGDGKDNLRFDPDTLQYIANLETKGLPLGDYQIKILNLNLLKADLEFKIE